MSILTKTQVLDIVKDELGAGLINIELVDSLIERNIDRALMLSTDHFSYTAYKTCAITKTIGSAGYVLLSDIDSSGIPAIINVYKASNIMNPNAALLGLGNIYIESIAGLSNYESQYASFINKLSNLESILGVNYKVVDDKLYVDHYYESVTVEYIPNTVSIENINEGKWLRWIIEYATALSKRQLAQARGRYIVDSNPAKTNAAELLSEANEKLVQLEDELENRGILLVSR